MIKPSFETVKALNDIQKIVELITDHSPIEQPHTLRDVKFDCNFSEEDFCKMVDRSGN
ncbi:MAG: hypothetical protein ACI4F6_10205 [Acutalibacteraceae bacterium]